MSLLEALQEKKVIVCVGSGGVGKTTTSAAIALRAAQDGARVCVLTIDPARRLANALGLEELGNVARPIEPSLFTEAGLEAPRGSLNAMMLDTKRTWDELVEKYASDEEQRERIYNNGFYKQISSALTGSHEFMAMEKVYDLHLQGEYDLLVVDTPPTKHALDFLDAPQKMINFMDEDILKWFLKPAREGTKFGLRMLSSSGAWVMKLLEKITGLQLLRDLSDFFDSFSGMYSGFVDRARAVQKLMHEPGTTFVLVTSPDPHTLEEARYFYERIEEYEMDFSGFVFNKMHPDFIGDDEARALFRRVRNKPEEVLEVLGIDGGSDTDKAVAGKLAANLAGYQVLADVDHADADQLSEVVADGQFPATSVPLLEEDVHDLSGLDGISRHLFGARPAPRKKAGAES